ncbi:MAG: hypothetical protein QW597_02995 [Thermoplasmataceae archaeon]
MHIGSGILQIPSRNKSIIIVSALVIIIAVSLIMFNDFVTFNTPEDDEVKLYSFALVGVTISFAVLFHFWRVGRGLSESRNEKVGNFLRLSFGSLWVLDGILQLQPEMSNGFISNVVLPVINGFPAFLRPYFNFITVTWMAHPVLYDSFSAIIQIAIGSGMLIFRGGHRLNAILLLSIIWGIIVWVFGEGFGGVISPGASFLTGFPGSALVYVMVSFVLLLRLEEHSKTRVISLFMVIVFSLSALEQALPSNGFWAYGGIPPIPGGMASNVQPFQLQNLLYWFSSVFSGSFTIWNSVFVALFVAIAIFWLFNLRFAPYLTILASIFIWCVFQDFGVLGGFGTDPNTALPMLLLSLSVIISQHPPNVYLTQERYKNTQSQ